MLYRRGTTHDMEAAKRIGRLLADEQLVLVEPDYEAAAKLLADYNQREYPATTISKLVVDAALKEDVGRYGNGVA